MDGTSVWPRTSPDGRPAAYVTRNAGKTWQRLDQGLPASQAWWTVKRQAMTVDARPAPALYLGTTSGELWIGYEEGARWMNIARHLPDLRGGSGPNSGDREPAGQGGAMQVLIPGALRSYTKASHVEAVGETLAALLLDLERRYPGCAFASSMSKTGCSMRIFINGLGVRGPRACLATRRLCVAIVLALSGG